MSVKEFCTTEVRGRDIQHFQEHDGISELPDKARKQVLPSDRAVRRPPMVKTATEYPTKVDEQLQPPCPSFQSAEPPVREESDRKQDEETAKNSNGAVEENCCAAGKVVRDVTSHCLSEGKRVLDEGKRALGDAAKIAGDYQVFAIDAVGCRISQSRQQAEACVAKARSSLETVASSTRETVNNSTKRLLETREALFQQSKQCVTIVDSVRNVVSVLVAQGKPRIVSTYSTGIKALRERNTQLAASALAQLFAFVIVMMATMLQIALKNEKIKYIFESLPHLPRTLQSFECVSALQFTKYIPVVGNQIFSSATSFVSEIKKNIEDFEKED